jgi:hypothetical protein
MSANHIIQLQKEVDEFEKKHKSSLDDSTMQIEEKQAIASEYTAKYKELVDLALSQLTEYKE